MKHIKIFLPICILLIILTGCKDKTKTTTCTLESDQKPNGYILNNKYTIYYSKDIVKKVEINQVISSEKNDILNSFKESISKQYESNNNLYGGYTYDVKVDKDKLEANITIDYTKVNLDKYSKDNEAMKEYLTDGKLTKDKLIKLYKTSGIKCEK